MAKGWITGKNTGPDGVSRCGSLRGAKCEAQAYEAEKAAEAVQAELAKASKETGSNLNNVYTFGGIFIVVILVFVYITKKK
jgi:LPXTG-motif cell wall-anchored protein